MSNAPIKTYQQGNIRVNIWQNEKSKSLSFDKSSKDEAGNWKTDFKGNTFPNEALILGGLLITAATEASERKQA